MEKINTLTKVLAIGGTVLVGLPLVAPLILSLILLVAAGMFRFDYLMPAELLPLVLIGGGLLIWASVRARRWVRLIGGCMVAAFALLLGSQLVAMFSGLASGAIEPAGPWWVLTLAGLILYDLVLIGVAVGGVLLVRDLFRASPLPAQNP